MAKTTDHLKVQILDLIQTRLEGITSTGTTYYRNVDQVVLIDDLPEEQWLIPEEIPRRHDYVITYAEVTDDRELGDTGRYQSFLTLAVAGFVRRKDRENPWQRSNDADTKVRAQIESDIYQAMVTPDDQLNMLSRTPFPGAIDPVIFTDPIATEHWAGVRTTWVIDYKPMKTDLAQT